MTMFWEAKIRCNSNLEKNIVFWMTFFFHFYIRKVDIMKRVRLVIGVCLTSTVN